MESLRSMLRPVARRLRNATAWLKDVQTKGVAGATSYWFNSAQPDWKVNSHWRDAAVEGWSDTWVEIGAAHVAAYKRFARSYDLHPPCRTLEWGVGGGANAIHFAPLTTEFVAIDVSQESLDETVRQVRNECATSIMPIRVSIEDQASPVAHLAGSVDLFVCFYVLELVPGEAQAQEIVRIAFQLLRPGGAAIIQAKYRSSVPRRRLWGSFSGNLANNYIVGIPEFWEFLGGVGFDVHQVELVPRNQLDRHYAYFYATRPA